MINRTMFDIKSRARIGLSGWLGEYEEPNDRCAIMLITHEMIEKRPARRTLKGLP